jgi:hypothetical protein
MATPIVVRKQVYAPGLFGSMSHASMLAALQPALVTGLHPGEQMSWQHVLMQVLMALTASMIGVAPHVVGSAAGSAAQSRQLGIVPHALSSAQHELSTHAPHAPASGIALLQENAPPSSVVPPSIGAVRHEAGGGWVGIV